MFAIPATSASSERAFSVGGRVITSTRTRLSIDRMSKIMRTKLNMDRVPTMKWDFLDDPADTPQLSRASSVASTATTLTIASTSSSSRMPPPSGTLRRTETSVSQMDVGDLDADDDDDDEDFNDCIEVEEDEVDEN
jgi:hypothetical protein